MPLRWGLFGCGDMLWVVATRLGRELLEDHDWLRARREEGWTVERIRAELGTSNPTVRAALAAAGLPPKLGGPTFPELYDPQWVRVQLETVTVTELARMVGCSTRSAKDAARRAGIAGRRPAQPALLGNRAWLEGQLRDGRSYDQIAGELGCSVKAVAGAVRSHGLNVLARRRRRFPQLYDSDWLQAALETATSEEVARRVGCSPEAVRAARRRIRPAHGETRVGSPVRP